MIRPSIKALLVDVDGVLVDGRPDDGLHWQTSLEQDLGLSADALREHFFAPYWNDIVLGRAGMMEHLPAALRRFAPAVSADVLVSYWFARDSRVVVPLLREITRARAAGVRVYLATNQEHLRADYLMQQLGLGAHVDGMFYSAALGAKKPDVEFFAKVQAALELPAEALLLIDDSLPNIDAAIGGGWQALHWTNGRSPEILAALAELIAR